MGPDGPTEKYLDFWQFPFHKVSVWYYINKMSYASFGTPSISSLHQFLMLFRLVAVPWRRSIYLGSYMCTKSTHHNNWFSTTVCDKVWYYIDKISNKSFGIPAISSLHQFLMLFQLAVVPWRRSIYLGSYMYTKTTHHNNWFFTTVCYIIL